MVNCFLTSTFTERLCNVGCTYFYRSDGIEVAGCLYYIIQNCICYCISVGLLEIIRKSVCVSVYNIYTVTRG
jgi:hypothetical protein